MTDQAIENQQSIEDIRHKYNSGEYTREQAVEAAQPYLDRINAKAVEIAGRHGVKPKKVTFMEVMR